MIADVLDAMADGRERERAVEVREKVRALCRDFPIYPDLA
jgi:glycine/serine hydroxymethyltransferase